MQAVKISVEEVRVAISKAENWKAPGNDKIHNYWIKQFASPRKCHPV